LHNKKLEQNEQVISSLEEQITKAQYEQSTLTKQLTDITQERDSLILAFSLIIDDKSSGQDYECSCKTFCWEARR
jgi:septal ring factor EnvC (AmiA/AmiB activator)